MHGQGRLSAASRRSAVTTPTSVSNDEPHLLAGTGRRIRHRRPVRAGQVAWFCACVVAATTMERFPTTALATPFIVVLSS